MARWTIKNVRLAGVSACMPKNIVKTADIPLFTAEEAIVEFAREKLKSYKTLPVTFYQIGDLVYDFSVNTSDGDTFKLSEAIEEYDAVMINFWYRTCYWCNEDLWLTYRS